MQKIIFLDFDGVLNSGDNSRIITFLMMDNPELMQEYYAGIQFDERCVRWLQWIIKETDAKLVISSSWRLQYELQELQAIWKALELPGEIIGYTPFETGLSMLGEHEVSRDFERGREIQAWIDEHKPDKYCILDDGFYMLHNQVFVQTDPEFGLTYDTAKLAVDYLNGLKDFQ